MGRLSRRNWLAASAAFDGRYLVDTASDDAGETLKVIDTLSNATAAEHRVREFDGGWRTDRAWLLAPWLLVTEANAFDPSASGSRLYRYDLRTGEGQEVTAISGFPEPWIVWDASGSVAVFDTRDPEQLTSCLWNLDVTALTWSQRWCAPRDWITGWLRLGPEATVTFRSQEGPHDGLEPCVRLYRLSLNDAADPTEITLQRQCEAFSGAGGMDWTAWSEVGLHSEDLEYSAGFGVSHADGFVSLGVVETGSISACDGWVYWQSYALRPQRETLVRWRPGGHVQQVFEAEPGNLLGVQECDGQWLTVMTAVPGQTETVLAADTRQ